MKRYLVDMNVEELGKVFDANEQLRNEVQEDMVESEMHWISEQLDFIRGSLHDWSIGAYNRNYITIADHGKFVEGMEEMDAAIPALIDSDKPLMDKASETRDKYYNVDMYSDEADEAAEELEQITKQLADKLIERFERTLEGCYNEEYQKGYFIEFYTDARLDADNCYIDSDDFILKEDITKTYN